ncbi:MAG: YggS family pyridoxal phosphate-dependent enzyme [Candidatus Omnitrophota bacterium]|jgi:pyridoxal phosphate enzyme (YggS family)|nr:MAG: YggS family pyridoxal phosphate-dependent enzyme [Candidatus Omnitrophota bacterium]
MVSENIAKVKQRIASACARAGRKPGEITVIAVSKYRLLREVEEVAESGICDIGENRLQEASLKHAAISRNFGNVRWHMVGHLQTNKAKQAVKIFDLIHSVDSAHLAQEIEIQASKINKIQKILVQVNISKEKTKSGFTLQDVKKSIRIIAGFKHIVVKGLMTIAPIVQAPEQARPYFRLLRELLNEINSILNTQHSIRELSMGMSDDFEVAVEEGATMLRIGRAIFEGSG